LIEARTPSEHHLLDSPGGTLRLTVDPIGARIASIVDLHSDVDLLLHTPWEQEHWARAYSASNSSVEWHRRYQGGWHTLIPHAGDPRTIDGVEHPFHGEAAWRAWRTVELSATVCALEIVLRTVPLRVTRRITVSDAGVVVSQRVENLSGAAVEFSWTEHPAFGAAVIGPRTSVRVAGRPVKTHFPEDGEAYSGFQTVLARNRDDPAGTGVAEIRSPDTGRLVRLRWDAEVLPYLYLWQEHGGNQGFPWWGQVNTIGLEPASRLYLPGEGDRRSLGPLRVDGDGTLTSWIALDLEMI
jgi:galactose mutarotase-like enzyme